MIFQRPPWKDESKGRDWARARAERSSRTMAARSGSIRGHDGAAVGDPTDRPPGARRRGEPKAGRSRILLVEDDPGDVLITREALESSKVPNHLAW